MANRPNERMDDDSDLRGDADGTPPANRSRDVEPTKSKPPIRWVQLAYDLEQYGDPDPDERGEVF